VHTIIIAVVLGVLLTPPPGNLHPGDLHAGLPTHTHTTCAGQHMQGLARVLKHVLTERLCLCMHDNTRLRQHD
jgi:hypothetical protein